MAAPQCPLCESTTRLAFSTWDRNRRVSRVSFDYYRCPSCGLIFIGTIPHDLPQYYAAGYHRLPRSRKALEWIGRRIRYQIELVARFAPGGRLLEIGAGYGSFAWLAKAAGYQVAALERDAGCCDYMQQVIGVDVTRTDCPSEVLSRRRGWYDVIVMWQVIEHIPLFWELLESAGQALAPGGILVIATPNPEAWQFGIMGARWPHVDAPRHLYLIPPGLMRRRVEGMGLECEMLTADDPGARRLNRFGWGQTVANLLPAKLMGTVWSRGVAMGAGLAVGTMTAVVERNALKGSAYTIVFKKTQGAQRDSEER